MRSSKSRSRSKSNRQRSIGNIINRVFDSSGPEGKVRGTPQQIIDKYLMLARDAQLSNDRVAEQNFLQHAEHYTRMLGEAMREQAREQEQRQPQPQQQGANGYNQGGYGQAGQGQGGNGNGQGGNGQGSGPRDRADQRADDQPEAAPLTAMTEDDGPGLVDTPEMRVQPGADSRPARTEPRPDLRGEPRQDVRPPRGPRPDRHGEKPARTEGSAKAAAGKPVRDAAPADPAPAVETAPEATAGEKPARSAPRSRGPRKPRAAAGETTPEPQGDAPAAKPQDDSSAAE